MTIHSLDELLFLFGTSLLFHVYTHTHTSIGHCVWWLAYDLPRRADCWIFRNFVKQVNTSVIKYYYCFFDDPADVGNLSSGSSAFSKPSLNIWKAGLENFEHYLARVWDECNCAVVWAFFGIAFLWDWNENWPFPVLWTLLSFPNLLAYWVQHFHSIIFQDLK